MHIKNDQLEVSARSHLERPVAVERGLDLESLRLEEIGQQLDACGIVVGNQNALQPATGRSSAAVSTRYWRTWPTNVRVSIGLAVYPTPPDPQASVGLPLLGWGGG